MAQPETAEPQTFTCDRPTEDREKVMNMLCLSDLLEADIQLVREGGANNLHYHTGQDGFFLVLDGSARFYDENEDVIAELDEREGILIPHGFRYWFEKAGDEPAEILHVAGVSDTLDDERIEVVDGE